MNNKEEKDALENYEKDKATKLYFKNRRRRLSEQKERDQRRAIDEQGYFTK